MGVTKDSSQAALVAERETYDGIFIETTERET
jgi:hypothetical protein